MRTNNRRKTTISVKMFISEFGENFMEHVKERLMDLESRCFLTRKDVDYRFDIKHVEHIQYDSPASSDNGGPSIKKEYVYGQFVVIDGALYFSESFKENKEVMQSPEVSSIYAAMNEKDMIFNEESGNLKKLDDSNIDYVIDRILSACPQASKAYMDIVQGMISRSNNK